MIIDMSKKEKEYNRAQNALDKVEGKQDNASLNEAAYWKRERNKNS